jgi:endonuclease/exonuclease/phosphatase family metal-dependent hydrolase
VKIVFLNTFYGELDKQIREYLISEIAETNVFCLQEVHAKMLAICRDVFCEYNEIFAEKYISSEEKYAQATYIKKPLKITASCPVMDSKDKVGLGLFTEIESNERLLNIINFHGPPKPGHKLDTPKRIDQSKYLIKYCMDLPGDKIIGGDFNISPETKSIKMFEELGYVDLIKKYKIKTTRNNIAWAKYVNHKKYFSDYVFVNPNLKIKRFEVPNIEVSDHLPMILEIEN